MLRCVRAEHLKLKRTFTKKLVWLAPIITVSLSAVLMAGQFFQGGSYNWWYAMLLPGMLSLICAGVVQKDTKKLSYRALLGLPVDQAGIWIGKISVCAWLLFVSCTIFLATVTLGGFVFGSSIPLKQSVLASLILFATFLWQVPLCLFLADRLGMFAAILLNFAANVAFIVGTANSTLWWIPYSIPARLMCPVIKVLPNGLNVLVNDPLLNTNVILPGVLIALALFVVMSSLTAFWFRNREAR